MDTLCKPNFMFLGNTVFEKNAMISEISVALFSDTVRPRNLKFAFVSKTVQLWNMKLGLPRVSIWVNIQKKFHEVNRSYNIGEKNDGIYKLLSHFSLKLFNRGT